jgi:hypothetical protein
MAGADRDIDGNTLLIDAPLGGAVESPAALWGSDLGGAADDDLRCDTPEDPFEDFEEDDFDDDFDDDFEEDWEDDLTEDEEFPDTFGGEESEEEVEDDEDGESPFSDDPDFDD